MVTDPGLQNKATKMVFIADIPEAMCMWFIILALPVFSGAHSARRPAATVRVRVPLEQ